MEKSARFELVSKPPMGLRLLSGIGALKQVPAAVRRLSLQSWRLVQNALRFYGLVWSKSKARRALATPLAELDGETNEWSTGWLAVLATGPLSIS
jgi:hypothetical protein